MEITVAVLGDGAVGKSSLINNFRNDGFIAVYKQTIGCEFYEKKITIRDQMVSLRLWDIGGQSIHSKSIQQYVSTSSAVFLVYDVTNTESFSNLDDWQRTLAKYGVSQNGTCTYIYEVWMSCAQMGYRLQYSLFTSPPNLPLLFALSAVYLVGNKVDMIAQRQVTLAQHNAYVLENGFKGSLFMSARSGENVVRAFYKAAGELLDMPLTEGELEEHTKVLKVELQGAAGSHDGGRTAFADQIEQEDREAAEAAAAARKANDEACMCVVC